MRVTIGELTEDYLPFTKKGNEATTIEIVPRKMVEMIIEKCRQDVAKYTHNSEEAACIKQYAEGLLFEFEKDGMPKTCRVCGHSSCVSPKDQVYGCPIKHTYFLGETEACECFVEGSPV